MKKIFLTFVLILATLSVALGQNVRVGGYNRSNGTYVQPHTRTAPNHTNRDNYSTRPNVNPYTGNKGYKKPDNNWISTPKQRSSSKNRSSYYGY
ncbi:MAG: hypothetical protein IPM47_03380 [Sphingobacteriales bacterium]|nr:MAG: hypothetical protein IPM47_03380 [Sphingobacteriales bacterium]